MVNLTPISFLYILSSLSGLLVSIYSLGKYHFSLSAARLVANPSDRRDAIRINKGILTREYVRLTTHVLGFLVGVASLWVKPQVRPPTPRYDHYFGFAVIIVLLWANIGTTLNTFIGFAEYKIVRRRNISEGKSDIADLRDRIFRVESVQEIIVAARKAARRARRKTFVTVVREKTTTTVSASEEREEGEKIEPE